MDTGWIWRISEGSTRPAIHTGDAPNGLAVETDGLVYCAQAVPGIARVSLGGKREILVTDDFNSPNDLAWIADELAFSDPTFGVSYSGSIARETAVYSWDGSTTRVVLRGLVQPNGLVAGPTGFAFVTDSGTQEVHRVQVSAGAPWRIVASTTLPRDRPGVVDGMAHWAELGLLLVAGPGGIWMLNVDSLEPVARAMFAGKVTNVALDSSASTALVTSHTGAWLGDLELLRAALID